MSSVNEDASVVDASRSPNPTSDQLLSHSSRVIAESSSVGMETVVQEEAEVQEEAAVQEEVVIQEAEAEPMDEQPEQADSSRVQVEQPTNEDRIAVANGAATLSTTADDANNDQLSSSLTDAANDSNDAILCSSIDAKNDSLKPQTVIGASGSETSLTHESIPTLDVSPAVDEHSKGDFQTKANASEPATDALGTSQIDDVEAELTVEPQRVESETPLIPKASLLPSARVVAPSVPFFSDVSSSVSSSFNSLLASVSLQDALKHGFAACLTSALSSLAKNRSQLKYPGLSISQTSCLYVSLYLLAERAGKESAAAQRLHDFVASCTLITSLQRMSLHRIADDDENTDSTIGVCAPDSSEAEMIMSYDRIRQASCAELNQHFSSETFA